MRNKHWLRFSVASLTLVAAGLGTFLVACGDDDDDNNPRPDSGTPDTGTPDGGNNNTDDGGTDGGDGGPKAPPAKLQLVNAATSLGADPLNASNALRVCYGLGETAEQANNVAAVAALPPLPDLKAADAQPFAGLFQGTGGPVATTGASFEKLVIVPYLVSAKSLFDRGVVRENGQPPNPATCKAIFNKTVDAGITPELVEGKDYWKLAPIPADTLKDGKSYILVLTGCAGDAELGADKCGVAPAGEPGNGNLAVTVHEVDNTTAIGENAIGAQFIQASFALDSSLEGQAGGALQPKPGFISDPQDPATFKAVNPGADVPTNTITALAQVEGVTVASDSFTANANAVPTANYTQLLPVISAISGGVTYANGKAFTFIGVGDPAIAFGANPAGPFNFAGFHFLALPNDPTIPAFE